MALSFGILSSKKHSLNQIASLVNIKISTPALHYKFTQKAVDFMEVCVQKVFKEKIKNTCKIKNKLLNQFNNVFIIDSTSFDISSKLKGILPGSGGAASKANCKIQVVYEYLSGALNFFEITSGNKPDGKYANEFLHQVSKNNLYLFDLGYFNFSLINKIIEVGAFFLSRYRTGTILYDLKTGKEIDLIKKLKKTVGDEYSKDIKVGRDKNKQFECRLVALRVPEKVAVKRRQDAKKVAAKKGRTATKKS